MSYMFFGCGNIKTIILPDDLTFIDSYQFAYCSSLTGISIPASVTTIGEDAFEICMSLEEITIPADVTSIGYNAFSCSGLKKVKSLMQTPCAISSNVFENVYSNATLYVHEDSKAAYKTADYWKDFKEIATLSIERGDANGDYTINTADIMEIKNFILGNPSDKFIEETADANNDGVVNVADIVTIINIIPK